MQTVLLAGRIGSHSLAGVQTKVAAWDAAAVTCSTCGASRRGRLEGIELADDGRTFTGEHFVVEER